MFDTQTLFAFLPQFIHPAAWCSRVTGTVLIGLGARLAFAERG